MSSADSAITKADVYQRLIDSLDPVESAGRWSPLWQTDLFRRIPADPPSLLATLREEFCEETLRSSGVVEQNHGENEQLVPALSQPGALLMPLFGKEREKPYDIIGENGCLSGRLPALAVLGDGRFAQALQRGERTLWLAFSMDDVAFLWSLDLPATLARGLRNLSGENVRRFCQAFGFTLDKARPEGLRPVRDWPHLRLVGWSPAELNRNEPDGLEPLRDHFGKLEQYLNCYFEELDVWSPSETDIKALRFCQEHGTPEDIRQKLHQSCGQRLTPLLWTPSAASQPVETFAEAQSRLQAASNRNDQWKLKQAFKDFQRLLQRDVIGPLHQAAEETACPLTAVVLRLAANQAQLSFQLVHQITRRGIDCDDRKPDPYLQQLLALNASYMTIFREWQRRE